MTKKVGSFLLFTLLLGLSLIPFSCFKNDPYLVPCNCQPPAQCISGNCICNVNYNWKIRGKCWEKKSSRYVFQSSEIDRVVKVLIIDSVSFDASLDAFGYDVYTQTSDSASWNEQLPETGLLKFWPRQGFDSVSGNIGNGNYLVEGQECTVAVYGYTNRKDSLNLFLQYRDRISGAEVKTEPVWLTNH